MIRVLSFLTLMLMGLPAVGQGINFETGTWKEAVAKAKSGGKLIFVDVYAVWCGPCKMMEQNIFPAKEVGDKYNSMFVNYKIDAEKGEGIALAKKYNVTLYPTGLYIDPTDEKLVYRAVGATDVADFIHRADNAMAEYKDTMSWADYQQQFKKGDYNKNFIIRYIQKADRTGRFADDALDVYVDRYTDTVNDETFNFLLSYTKTFDNNAVAFLFTHRATVNLLHAVESPDYFMVWKQRLPYFTFQKAIAEKDEKLIESLYHGILKYGFPKEITGIYNYRKAYYEQIGDSVKARKISFELADYLVNLPQAAFDTVNRDSRLIIEQQIENQLLSRAVPDSLHTAIIEKTIKEHPEYSLNANLAAAQALNESALLIYHDQHASGKEMKKALVWAQKARDLTDQLTEGPVMSGTYARLLYQSGKQKEATAIIEAAVTKAKSSGIEELPDLEKLRSQIKAGQL